jgi:hypothetical protein
MERPRETRLEAFWRVFGGLMLLAALLAVLIERVAG